MDEYITVKEAAKIIGIGERAVRQRLVAHLLLGHEVDTPRGKVWYVSKKSAQGSGRKRAPRKNK